MKWRECRDFGLSVSIWPLSWIFGFYRSIDRYSRSYSLHVGPFTLTLDANIGETAIKRREELL